MIEMDLQLLTRRFETEEAADRLRAKALAGGLDAGPADIAAGERPHELDRTGRRGEWRPLMPFCLETLQDSVPPDATPWSELRRFSGDD